ncbi:hypothetical protein RvVAR031_33720 [Agrobacterium vitis]|nr:hypothetical protein RvVAR031_33720 [Agrobacterium vitis]
MAFKPKLWTYAKASPTIEGWRVDHIDIAHRLSHKPMAEGCLYNDRHGPLAEEFLRSGIGALQPILKWF